MAAAVADIALEEMRVETGADPEALVAANPLGKVPTLVLDDGSAVFDSRVIMQHLDRVSGSRLFPLDATERRRAECLEALADGIADCAVAHVYERRSRPEGKVHQPWLDRQWSKIVRALDSLDGKLPRLGSKADGGQVALRASIGYLELRFAGKWEQGHRPVEHWAAGFDESFPDLKRLLPG